MMNQTIRLFPFMVLISLIGYEELHGHTSWHLSFPICGRDSYDSKNRFIPYQFSLWDLAPKQGKGVRIVMLDTGIAGYEFPGDNHYSKHPELDVRYDPAWGCLSTIKHEHYKARFKTYEVCPLCLPAIRTDDVRRHKRLIHGTHAYGLITSKTFGLAPQAEVIVINMFTQEGTCKVSTLIQALEKAISLKPDILLIEANIDQNLPKDCPAIQRIESLCSQVPWVIVPAGNNGVQKHGLSQPAGITPAIISVGAFGIKNKGLYVPSFSQREQDKGPDILAPGCNITSTGVSFFENDPGYTTLNGTSSAAAIVTAFIALLLGEFKEKFSKDQLRTIIRQATWQFEPNTIEHNASIYGILDIRLALFISYILENESHIQPHQIKEYLLETCPIKNDQEFLEFEQEEHQIKKTDKKPHNNALQKAINNCMHHVKKTTSAQYQTQTSDYSPARDQRTSRPEGGSPKGEGAGNSRMKRGAMPNAT